MEALSSLPPPYPYTPSCPAPAAAGPAATPEPQLCEQLLSPVSGVSTVSAAGSLRCDSPDSSFKVGLNILIFVPLFISLTHCLNLCYFHPKAKTYPFA